LFRFFVRIEKKEKKHAKDSITAITEVNLSMPLDSILLPICNEVITKRQNPKRLAEVLKICCEVLFAIIEK
jgi:hypothetical protein